MSVLVALVRHGERLDEVDRREWHRIRTPQTRHDPPLTESGWHQAAKAGNEMKDLLKSWREARLLTGSSPIVYSSPTARTLSTAAGICMRIGLSEINPVYALNCCAAAQTYGVACQGFPEDPPDHKSLGMVSLTCWPPLGDPARVDDRMKRHGPASFVEAVKELADLHSIGEVIIVVSHREGIWEMKKHVGNREFKARYCDISTYLFDKTEMKLSAVDKHDHVSDVEPVLLSMPLVTRLHRSQQVEAVSNQRADTLEDVLARGSGQIKFHRRGSAESVRLWQTPGVRGQWIGRPVRNHEIVNLLSAPVQSDGVEGDFVLIKTNDGAEGWTKVRNVHLVGSTRQTASRNRSIPRCS